MYVLQVFFIGGILLVLFRRESLILHFQIIIWAVAVSFLFMYFGFDGQLNFYSNDQSFYVSVLHDVPSKMTWEDLDYWLTSAKVPYTGPAFLLYQAGLHEALALKTVSLLFLIGFTRRILRSTESTHISAELKCAYLTGCGAVGVFFSTLCLRETTMMYFVYRYATDPTGAFRILMLAGVYLLRPHLAAALLAAEAISIVWDRVKLWKKTSHLHIITLLVIGSVIGINLWYWGLVGFSGLRSPWDSDLGIKYLTRFASNFVGLHFLTARDSTLEMTIGDLLYARLLFSESLVIPILFSLSIVLGFHRTSSLHRRTLLSLAIFTTISAGTDYLSFRQNLPLFGLLGVSTVQLTSQSRSLRSSNADKLQFNATL